MGWWQSGRDPQNTLGDGPADVLANALGRLARDSGVKPTIHALLGHLAAVLRDDGAELIADAGEPHRRSLLARFEPPAPDVVAEPQTDRLDLLASLRGATRDIRDEYERDLSRKPKLSELLGTVVFVLAVRPERYLSEANGSSLVDLTTDSTR